MDSLVAVGSSAAFIYGIFAVYRLAAGFGHNDMELVHHYAHQLYFESAAMILTLVTVGKYLEARSKSKTSDALGKLVDLAPKTAVIVRDGRVLGAGCMLPLSKNVNLSRDLGMRHRAGIGMSENSDAVVVIVSEETGSISAAMGGMLKRHLAPETLDRLLRNELKTDEDDGEKKSDLFPLVAALFNRGKKEGTE